MSSDYDEGYRAGLQKSRDVARPHIEAMEARITRTRKLLEGINELYWNDFAHLSAMLEVCIEILDGKRDEGQDE